MKVKTPPDLTSTRLKSRAIPCHTLTATHACATGVVTVYHEPGFMPRYAKDIEAHLDIDPAKRPRRTLPSATRSINKRNPGPRQRTKATA